MKNSGFTFTEIIISAALFIIAILPVVELNKGLLKTERQYNSIEHNRKNCEFLEKQIRGRGYKKLKNSIGKYVYEFEEGEKRLSLGDILSESELIFPAEKNDKVEINIETLEVISSDKKEGMILIQVIYLGKYKKFRVERVITEYEEYYNKK